MPRHDRRRKYQAVEAALDRVGAPDWQLTDLEEWASGEVAMEHFGGEADAVDSLFLLAYYSRQMNYVLYSQIEACLIEGHSWNEIAEGLGVSRQAATKRFDQGVSREQLTALRQRQRRRPGR